MSEANPAPHPDAYAIPPEIRARLEAIEQWSDRMQDTKLSSVERVVAPRKTRGWIVALGTAVVVLLVGIASFAFLTGDPGEVANVDPTITFTGAECNYEGTTEFALGVDRAFRFVNESDANAEVTVFRVPDGTTLQDIDPDDIFSVFEDSTGPRSFLDFGASGVEPGAEETFTANPSGGVPDEAGEWLVLCYVLERDGVATTPAGDRPGVILHVTGS